MFKRHCLGQRISNNCSNIGLRHRRSFWNPEATTNSLPSCWIPLFEGDDFVQRPHPGMVDLRRPQKATLNAHSRSVKRTIVMKDMALEKCFYGIEWMTARIRSYSTRKNHLEVVLAETILVCLIAHSSAESQETLDVLAISFREKPSS